MSKEQYVMNDGQAQVRQSPTDDLIGRVIHGRFRVLSLIARGGMGRVYRAEQVPLGRLVALKVLDRPGSTDGSTEFESRFLIEASTAAKLQHSNTVTVFDYGRTDDGVCFIAMELVEGLPLRDAIRAGAPFSAQRTVHIALQIARSLREAHRLEVIHRDLKPANVLLTRHDDDGDFVKVLDFGLVKHVDNGEHEGLTREGLFLGSPKYMAPEHILGDRLDARADVYSLGVCMYEMLTGQPPFSRESTVKILMAHMHEQAPALTSANVPPALADLVARCLAKSPDHRPASMDDVIIALKRAVGSDTLTSGEYALGSALTSTARYDAHSPSSGAGFRRPPLGPAPRVPMPTPSIPPSPGMPQLASAQHTIESVAMPVAPKKSSATFVRAAVVGALVMAGAGLGVAHVAQKPDTAVGTAVQPQAQEPASTVKVLSAPAAEAAMVAAAATEAKVGDEAFIFVRLDSQPSGAMVLFEGRHYGPTPANVEIVGPSVARGKEVTFIFEKPGYEPVRITRVVKMQNLSLETALHTASGGGDVKRARSLSMAPRASASAAPQPTSEPVVAPVPAPVAPPPAPAVVAATPAPAIQAPAPQAVAPVPAPAATPAPAPSNKPVARMAKASSPIGAMPALEYPRAARRAGITGTVVARVYVRADGRVGNVEILEGHEAFHETVRNALMSRRYEPARLTDGTPVADSHVVRLPFNLQ